jgi:CTP:phosphocholine cytidylyltransferase-like protein
LDAHASEPMHVDRIISHLNNSFINDCEVIAGWFDHQFYCEMDIYAHRFNYDQGYVRISNPTVELFLYRVENLSSLENELAIFLDIPDFKLSRENAAKEKSYCEVYRELMASYTVPRSILEKLYATPYMQFFYSDQERSAFMDYWSSPRTQ